MRYPFEEKTFKQIRLEFDDLKALNHRLKLEGDERLQNSNIFHKVKTFLNVYNGNISWYLNAISEENKKLNFYKWMTISLILFLPFIVLGITSVISLLNDEKDIEMYSSISIAILTSIFGFHKVLNTWLAKRKLLSIFQEASARLKSRLYSFEDRWNNGGIYASKKDKIVSDEFDDAIEKAIKEGRLIADEERTKFYQHIENPEVDLGNIFTNSFSNATSFFKNFQSKRLARKLEELEQLRKEDQFVAISKELAYKLIDRDALEKEILSLKPITSVGKTQLAKLNVDLATLNAEIETLENKIKLNE